MYPDDRTRMLHMRDAAHDAMSFIRGRDRTDLQSDRMLALALERCIEIIGEAASQITPEGRQRNPAIPWADIIGMRNRLIHAYHDVELDTVWSTVTEDLPALVGALESVLPPD